MRKLIIVLAILGAILLALFWNNIFNTAPESDTCSLSTPECIVDEVKVTKNRDLCEGISKKSDLYYSCIGFSSKTLDDIDVCLTYPTTQAKNICKDSAYFELSQYNQVLDHCYWINDQSFQAFCVGEFAQRNSDVSLCDDFSDGNLKCICYNRFLSETNEETCKSLQGDQKDTCLSCID